MLWSLVHRASLWTPQGKKPLSQNSMPKEVSTPDDPATSKLGETFYAFWPRSVFGSFNSAWKLEKVRAAKRGMYNQFVRLLSARIRFVVPPKSYPPNGRRLNRICCFRLGRLRTEISRSILDSSFRCFLSAGTHQLHRALWLVSEIPHQER